MKVLVVGASGFLGRHIYKHFKAAGNLVTGTFCSNQADPSMIRFDLNMDDLESIDDFSEETDKCAILCAAETRLDTCENEREKSYQINVASTIRLIEQLKKRNYYIIFVQQNRFMVEKKEIIRKMMWRTQLMSMAE
jgi:nucleoside-diphosphate-sugar epimerase